MNNLFRTIAVLALIISVLSLSYTHAAFKKADKALFDSAFANVRLSKLDGIK